jgi:hypothetical protein
LFSGICSDFSFVLFAEFILFETKLIHGAKSSIFIHFQTSDTLSQALEKVETIAS